MKHIHNSSFLIHNSYMKILVFGTFDLLHPGHEYFLEQASSRGDLTVVVARDSTVRKIKGRAPVQHEQERRAAIVDRFPRATVILGNDAGDYLAPVRSVTPDLILLGYDQKLPPGVTERDLPCPVERAEAYQPERFKSSLMRKD